MRTFRIGRVPESNDLVLPSSVISSKHAEIVIDDYNRMMFTDYSTNGTYINNQLLRHGSCAVTVNDRIVFPDGTALDWNLVLGSGAAYQAAPMQPGPAAAPDMGTMAYPNMAAAGANPGMADMGNGGAAVPPAGTGGSVRKLDFSQTFGDAFRIGGKNILSVIGTVFLWLLTCWIPYINVGTTIALALLPLKMSEGKVISPLYIFESKYRKWMGEYLLTVVMMVITFSLAALTVIPAIVLMYSWSQTLFYLVGCRMNPTQAIHASNEATYGSKWIMFFVRLVFGLIYGVVMGLIVLLGVLLCRSIGGIIVFVLLAIVVSACIYSISNAVSASIWMQLRDNVAHE